MALETPRVQADVVEAQEFPHLARQYSVQSVPKTVINSVVEVVGAVPEAALLQRVLTAAGREDLLAEFVDAQAQEGLGGPTTVVGR
jgi:predicted DsbA family dithiol-disulfide isomerase